jgi:hypothetical protein
MQADRRVRCQPLRSCRLLPIGDGTGAPNIDGEQVSFIHVGAQRLRSSCLVRTKEEWLSKASISACLAPAMTGAWTSATTPTIIGVMSVQEWMRELAGE